jgi:hypothetical protein
VISILRTYCVNSIINVFLIRFYLLINNKKLNIKNTYIAYQWILIVFYLDNKKFHIAFNLTSILTVIFIYNTRRLVCIYYLIHLLVSLSTTLDGLQRCEYHISKILHWNGFFFSCYFSIHFPKEK